MAVGGVDPVDYPDFADAYISYAEHCDGTPLTDDELDELNDKHGDYVNMQAAIKMLDDAMEDLAEVTK